MTALRPASFPASTACPQPLYRNSVPAVAPPGNEHPHSETTFSRVGNGTVFDAPPPLSQSQQYPQQHHQYPHQILQWASQPQSTYQPAPPQYSQQYQQWQQQPPVTYQVQSAPAALNHQSSLVPWRPLPASAAPPAIPGFFAPAAQSQALMAVFGANYVAENAMEVFYVREKPVVPQPGDGVIKMPAPGQMQFEEGFKVDVTGHGVTAQRTLKDLPSKDVISCQRRRKTAMSATVMICAGSEADSKSMVASVRKSSETRAVIEVEKKGWTKYVAEGDLLQRNYAVTQNGKQVAQVMRDDNARAAVTSKHSYAVQVAPGTDCVLMITAAMAIEDIYHA
ncbi:hypothetical protein ABBQ38_005684 [Trebouxia sp. C0009 RCD-2024]